MPDRLFQFTIALTTVIMNTLYDDNDNKQTQLMQMFCQNIAFCISFFKIYI